MKFIPGPLKGDDVQEAFDKGTRPLVEQVLRVAGYEPDAAWSLGVVGVHRYGSTPRPSSPVVRLGAARDATRQIDLTVRPSIGHHTFDLRISVPRTTDWIQAQNAISKAVSDYTSRPASPPPAHAPAATPPASSPSPSTTKPAELLMSGIGRLEKMRTGLDAVLSIARDAQASAEMRAEIKQRHDAAAEVARPLLTELQQAETILKQHQKHVAAIKDDIASTEARLELLRISLQSGEEEYGSAMALYDRAEAAASEPAKVWDLAIAELAEADRLETERLKAINEMPGIAGMLAALESMNK